MDSETEPQSPQNHQVYPRVYCGRGGGIRYAYLPPWTLGGLLVAVFYFYKLKFTPDGKRIRSNKDVTALLKDELGFMTLRDEYYRGHIMLLG